MITLDNPDHRGLAWLAGAGASALLHVCAMLTLTRIPAPAPVFEPAMMLELAPLTQAPVSPPEPAPVEDPAPSPPVTVAETPADPQVAPVQELRQEEAVSEPDPEPVEAHEPPQPLPQPPAEVALPDSPPVPEPPVPMPPPRPATRPAAKPRPVVRPLLAAPEATAAPAPATPAPPIAQLAVQATADWRARLLAHLNRFKRYPAAALMRRVQGVAFVHVLLMPDGTARDVRLHASSGAAMLDEEALALIRRATPLPARTDAGPTELVVPVQFAVK